MVRQERSSRGVEFEVRDTVPPPDFDHSETEHYYREMARELNWSWEEVERICGDTQAARAVLWPLMESRLIKYREGNKDTGLRHGETVVRMTDRRRPFPRVAFRDVHESG